MQLVTKDVGRKCIWVIPNHFNKCFDMTLSELDETQQISSTCGFIKPDKISLSFMSSFSG